MCESGVGEECECARVSVVCEDRPKEKGRVCVPKW